MSEGILGMTLLTWHVNPCVEAGFGLLAYQIFIVGSALLNELNHI